MQLGVRLRDDNIGGVVELRAFHDETMPPRRALSARAAREQRGEVEVERRRERGEDQHRGARGHGVPRELTVAIKGTVRAIECALGVVARVVAHLITEPVRLTSRRALRFRLRRRGRRRRGGRGRTVSAILARHGDVAVTDVEAAPLIVAGVVAVAVGEQVEGAAIGAERRFPREVHLLPRHAHKVLRPHGRREHHVVIEVNEVVGEAADAVDVGLDRGRGEDGEVRHVWVDLRVRHHADAREREVEPLRDLVRRHEVHVAHPRRVLYNRAE